MDFSLLDDAALLALLAQLSGTHAPDHLVSGAIGALYDRYGRLVYSVAVHLVGDDALAQEITQDVFVRAWQGAGSYHAEMGKAAGWLASITRHRAIDELRRQSSRPEKARADWPEDIGQETAEGLPATDGPEGGLELRMSQRAVRQALAALPADQREALALAYYQGLSHSEIAERLGEPLGTVKSRIRLAMQKLRETLAEVA